MSANITQGTANALNGSYYSSAQIASLQQQANQTEAQWLKGITSGPVPTGSAADVMYASSHQSALTAYNDALAAQQLGINGTQAENVGSTTTTNTGLTVSVPSTNASLNVVPNGTPGAFDIFSMTGSAPNPITVPAPVQVPGTTSTTGSTIAGPVIAPQTSVSPTDQASAASQGTDNAIAALAQQLAGMQAAQSGSGSGSTDPYAPGQTAADLAAIQPQTTPTSSTGISPIVLVGIAAVLGIGGFFWWKHMHKGE